MKNIATVFSTSLLALALVGCGTNNDTPIVKEINDINISPSTASIRATTNEFELQASANYNDGTSADITQAARWESGDYSKLLVSYGKILPKANGDDNQNSAFISVTASYKDLSDTATIELIPVTGVQIIDTNETNGSGLSNVAYTFSATATYGDGVTKAIDQNNSLNTQWSVEGNTSSITIDDGKAIIVFNPGESNVSVAIFDKNDTFTIQIN